MFLPSLLKDGENSEKNVDFYFISNRFLLWANVK